MPKLRNIQPQLKKSWRMNGLRLRLFLPVGCILLASSTLASGEDSAEHEVECQGSIMRLSCLNRSFALTIEAAVYGRSLPGSRVCPKLDQMSSSSSDELICEHDVYGKVKERCDGRMNCSIPVNKETLNEPCPNVYKYLSVAYKCEDVLTRNNRQALPRPVVTNLSPTSSFILQPSTQTPEIRSSTVDFQPTPSMVVTQEQLSVIHEQTSYSNTTSTSRSSSHSVSVTSVSQARFTATAIKNFRSTPLKSSSNPALKTTENISIQTHAIKGRQGTMKLFHFILSFQIVREENIEKHTTNSVVWFCLGVLVGLLLVIAVLVFFRVQRSRRKRLGKPSKANYSKQKMIHDGFMEEKVELHSKEIEALEMESQFGESV